MQALAGDPLDSADVVAGNGDAADYFANIIDQDIVVFGAAGCVAHDAFEDVEAVEDFDYESGFFEHFAVEGVFE